MKEEEPDSIKSMEVGEVAVQPTVENSATARRLVMTEGMPVQPGTVVEVKIEYILRILRITGSLDYVVALAGEGDEAGNNVSADGGLVVIVVMTTDKGFQPKSLSQAIAGAAAIRHNCNSRKRRREWSGGPLHVVRTDGIRWQCGRVEERTGQCPRVLLGGVVKLRFSAGG